VTARATILIVDDDYALLEALPETIRLRMPDAEVDICDAASTALERILAIDYDVIVTDIKMPGMDGLALLDKIRMLRPDTPTVLITGHGEHDLAIQALRAGAYDYIQKPIDRDYIIASLRRAVQVRALKRQITDQQAALERHATELEQTVQARTQDLRDAVERVRALTEASTAIHAAHDVVQVLSSVVEAACRLSGAGLGLAGFFRGRDHSRLADAQSWNVASMPRDVAERLGAPTTARVFAHVFTLGESERLDDVSAHPVFRDIGEGPVPLASWVAVPVSARNGRVLGVIAAGDARPRQFTADAQAELEALARQAALALENAVLYERERGIAETLQRSLLPDRLPEIPGVALAARYLPGSTEAVGGDWYDVFTLPNGQIALVMGDVAGRGVWAASVMGQLRNTLRAYALEGNPPAVIAERLNRLIEPGAMATLLYLVFDPATWTARYVNLGHPPALVLMPEGGASFLDGGSPPLGTMLGVSYREQTAVIRPGSTIVLYTDGLVEVRGELIDDGLARVRESVAGGAALDIESLLDHLLQAGPNRKTMADDVALLALRASLLDPGRLTLRLPAVPSSLVTLRHTLRRWFGGAQVADGEAYEILTACNEACANAIEHAYGPADETFELDAGLSDGTVTIAVRDTGRWRDARDHHGHGLKLMQALMDSVDVSSGPDGTKIQMTRRLRREIPV
jgi:serine phosphatase RsbU (regulator of sigma subunit)/FixJ family two-component response regulator/anti-sigma regulatory factor (Ser/Thr protein kinase)